MPKTEDKNSPGPQHKARSLHLGWPKQALLVEGVLLKNFSQYLQLQPESVLHWAPADQLVEEISQRLVQFLPRICFTRAPQVLNYRFLWATFTGLSLEYYYQSVIESSCPPPPIPRNPHHKIYQKSLRVILHHQSNLKIAHPSDNQRNYSKSLNLSL